MLQVGASFICVIVQEIWDSVGPVKSQKLGYNLHSGAGHFSDSIFQVNVVGLLEAEFHQRLLERIFKGHPHPLK